MATLNSSVVNGSLSVNGSLTVNGETLLNKAGIAFTIPKSPTSSVLTAAQYENISKYDLPICVVTENSGATGTHNYVCSCTDKGVTSSGTGYTFIGSYSNTQNIKVTVLSNKAYTIEFVAVGGSSETMTAITNDEIDTICAVSIQSAEDVNL